MRRFIIIALALVPPAVFASSESWAEALFDQARIKPFAARAAGFEKFQLMGLDASTGLPSPISRDDDLVFSVPGRHPWPVLSPSLPPELPDAKLLIVQVHAQAPLDNDPGPAIW